MTKPHISVLFVYAECDYYLTKKVHINLYVRDHTYEKLYISKYLSKLLLLSYVMGILSHCRYIRYIYIKSARYSYRLVDRCEGFHKYVFLINKILMYILVNTLVGKNDISIDNDWKWRQVWHVVR